jgi:hypothetical protein
MDNCLKTAVPREKRMLRNQAFECPAGVGLGQVSVIFPLQPHWVALKEQICKAIISDWRPGGLSAISIGA